MILKRNIKKLYKIQKLKNNNLKNQNYQLNKKHNKKLKNQRIN